MTNPRLHLAACDSYRKAKFCEYEPIMPQKDILQANDWIEGLSELRRSHLHFKSLDQCIKSVSTTLRVTFYISALLLVPVVSVSRFTGRNRKRSTKYLETLTFLCIISMFWKPKNLYNCRGMWLALPLVSMRLALGRIYSFDGFVVYADWFIRGFPENVSADVIISLLVGGELNAPFAKVPASTREPGNRFATFPSAPRADSAHI